MSKEKLTPADIKTIVKDKDKIVKAGKPVNK